MQKYILSNIEPQAKNNKKKTAFTSEALMCPRFPRNVKFNQLYKRQLKERKINKIHPEIRK